MANQHRSRRPRRLAMASLTTAAGTFLGAWAVFATTGPASTSTVIADTAVPAVDAAALSASAGSGATSPATATTTPSATGTSDPTATARAASTADPTATSTKTATPIPTVVPRVRHTTTRSS